MWKKEKVSVTNFLEFFKKIAIFINSLPNDTILDWSKLNAFAEDKIIPAGMMIFVYDRFENIVGIKRKCWLPAFSPFPTMFSKGYFLRVFRVEIV